MFDVKKYVNELGGSAWLIEKINKLKLLADDLCPESVEEIYISEYKKEDDSRVIENVCFFSSNYVLESKRVYGQNINIDIMCINEYIDRIEIDYINYEYKKSSENSKFIVLAYIGGTVLQLKSSGSNCDNLWDVFNKYLKTNLYKCD